MKGLRTIITVVPFLIMIGPLSSCTDDNDIADMAASENIAYRADLATVITPSEIAGKAIIESDNGGTAYVINPDMLSRYGLNKEGQRIFYLYTYTDSPLGEEENDGPFIRIMDLQEVLTKSIDILKNNEEDNYGNDAINYISYSISAKYLTLQFQVRYSDSDIKHRISLVAKADAITDANGYLDVELRHNAEGDGQDCISGIGYVSFPLSTSPGYEEGTLKGFRMKYNSLEDNEETVIISYN